MFSLEPARFEHYVNQAINELPEPFASAMNNVAFVIEGVPSEEQRKKLQLSHHQSLFGLYEGIPLTQRGSGYTLVLPDKITIFKDVIESVCNNEADVAAQVKQTVWHEIAHHFGLGHGRIEELDRKKHQGA